MLLSLMTNNYSTYQRLRLGRAGIKPAPTTSAREAPVHNYELVPFYLGQATRKLWVDIATPLPNVPPGSARIPPNPRSSAPASTLGDTPVPTNSSVPSPRESGPPPLRPICRIVLLPPPAYQHSRSHYLTSYWKNARAVSDEPLRLAPEYTLTIRPTGHCSISDNPRAALRHGYQCGPAVAPISASDISSP